ncbi:hypothetical protein PENTCL1PPCAC_10502, partial [Pristionchus entomophagus]
RMLENQAAVLKLHSFCWQSAKEQRYQMGIEQRVTEYFNKLDDLTTQLDEAASEEKTNRLKSEEWKVATVDKRDTHTLAILNLRSVVDKVEKHLALEEDIRAFISKLASPGAVSKNDTYFSEEFSKRFESTFNIHTYGSPMRRTKLALKEDELRRKARERQKSGVEPAPAAPVPTRYIPEPMPPPYAREALTKLWMKKLAKRDEAAGTSQNQKSEEAAQTSTGDLLQEYLKERSKSVARLLGEDVPTRRKRRASTSSEDEETSLLPSEILKKWNKAERRSAVASPDKMETKVPAQTIPGRSKRARK